MASRKSLEELHDKIAQNMLRRLDEDAEQNMLTDAATLGVIVKFLKDNAVTADPAEQSQLDDLRKRLTEKAQARKPALSVVAGLREQDKEIKEA